MYKVDSAVRDIVQKHVLDGHGVNASARDVRGNEDLHLLERVSRRICTDFRASEVLHDGSVSAVIRVAVKVRGVEALVAKEGDELGGGLATIHKDDDLLDEAFLAGLLCNLRECVGAGEEFVASVGVLVHVYH